MTIDVSSVAATPSAATGRATNAAGLVPGDGLLHPAMIGAIGLLIANDHVLKAAYPGVVTGKLSDVAGLLFFPALLVAAAELALAVTGRNWRLGRTAVAVACLASAVGFALVQLTQAGAQLFEALLGGAQAVVAGTVAALAGGTPPAAASAAVVADPWDLVALVALVPAALIGWRRADRLRADGGASA